MGLIDGTSGNDFLTGTPFADEMYGFDGLDTLEGNAGSDFLSGGRQRDRLLGGSSADEIYGGKGPDRLFGGSGFDTLSGDRGNDTLEGNTGTDIFFGGSGADLFLTIPGENDSVRDFNGSEGDVIDEANSFSSSILSTSTVSEEPSMPFFVELKQQGNDLLVRNSLFEGYSVTLTGNGEYINDPIPLLSSINFITDPLLANSVKSFQAEEDASEAETHSEIDPLTRLREAEANLIEVIEHVENGGLPSELGVLGPGADIVTAEQTEQRQAALSEIQGYISDELARQEEAALADNFLLPEVLEPGKQVFVIEEGTSIPLDIQQEMMGGEILFVPSGYFDPTPASEGFF
ncbi:MAG: calcium-binding protein [Okeania sp. SIO3C4]|nr:calcium-binding protein [Okeania sp. SIO3C4]